MTDIAPFQLPDELESLNAGGSVFRFIVETGTVVDTPTGTDNSISFFLKQDNGQENDLTLQTSMKAREGHRVSVLYVGKGEDSTVAHAHGWINHTTGKIDFMPDTARMVAGDKISNFFLHMSLAAMNTTEGLMSMGGGFINLLLLPITLLLLAFAIVCMALGSLFGIQSASTVKAIMTHTKKIVAAINPDYEILVREKRSKLKTFFKWVLIALVVWVVVASIADYMR